MKILVKDPWIAKETFNFVFEITKKLNYDLWVEFVTNNKNYFDWKEETELGAELLQNIGMFPEEFREGILGSLHKTQACAEFNIHNGYYEVILTFNKQFGIISTTFQKKIKPHHLRMLLDMATYLDAYLLHNGTEIIDESFIEK